MHYTELFTDCVDGINDELDGIETIPDELEKHMERMAKKTTEK